MTRFLTSAKRGLAFKKYELIELTQVKSPLNTLTRKSYEIDSDTPPTLFGLQTTAQPVKTDLIEAHLESETNLAL